MSKQTYLHVVCKFSTLPFPCLNYLIVELHSMRDILLRARAAAYICEQIPKVWIIDNVNRLPEPLLAEVPPA
jgi:hypothetical protein